MGETLLSLVTSEVPSDERRAFDNLGILGQRLLQDLRKEEPLTMHVALSLHANYWEPKLEPLKRDGLLAGDRHPWIEWRF